jgi:hypothetical protein
MSDCLGQASCTNEKRYVLMFDFPLKDSVYTGLCHVFCESERPKRKNLSCELII